jgi:phosphoribosyl 1,2-cyclic phosphate phosphodiesterase
MIACDCAVCTSDDPRDRRTRSSALVELDGRSILIDTTPELRIQCIAQNVRRVEAVLYTHFHADHVTGLDDLRRFNHLNGRITCYADEHTAAGLHRMFPYAFEPRPDYPSAKPDLGLEIIRGPIELFGHTVIPIPLFHGPLPVLGFRFGPFAYCTDCNHIPPASMELLCGVQALILDGLRHRPHPTHFTIAQAVEVARQIGARRTWFTHVAHDLPHEATSAALPEGMALAHDGQVIEMEF